MGMASFTIKKPKSSYVRFILRTWRQWPSKIENRFKRTSIQSWWRPKYTDTCLFLLKGTIVLGQQAKSLMIYPTQPATRHPRPCPPWPHWHHLMIRLLLLAHQLRAKHPPTQTLAKQRLDSPPTAHCYMGICIVLGKDRVMMPKSCMPHTCPVLELHSGFMRVSFGSWIRLASGWALGSRALLTMRFQKRGSFSKNFKSRRWLPFTRNLILALSTFWETLCAPSTTSTIYHILTMTKVKYSVLGFLLTQPTEKLWQRAKVFISKGVGFCSLSTGLRLTLVWHLRSKYLGTANKHFTTLCNPRKRTRWVLTAKRFITLALVAPPRLPHVWRELLPNWEHLSSSISLPTVLAKY